jgi:hypothetical protein
VQQRLCRYDQARKNIRSKTSTGLAVGGCFYLLSVARQLVISFRSLQKVLADLLHQFLQNFTIPFFVFLEGAYAAFGQITHRDYTRVNSAYATQTSTMYMPIAFKHFVMSYISFSVKIWRVLY